MRRWCVPFRLSIDGGHPQGVFDWDDSYPDISGVMMDPTAIMRESVESTAAPSGQRASMSVAASCPTARPEARSL